jgi:class 3 adenylate cyclase/CheY-like chemotaxis protein
MTQQSRPHVLVIDDNNDIRQFVVNYVLLPHSYEPILARDGAEGLSKALTHVPDLILMDYEMPRMTGLQVLEALQAHALDIPVILMTSHGTEEIAVRVFRLGVRDYIIKPFTEAKLLQAIQRVMSEVRLRQEKAALTRQLMRANQQLRKRLTELNTLYQIGKSVTALMPLDILLGRIADAALYVTAAEKCTLMLYDPETGQLRERVSKQRKGVASDLDGQRPFQGLNAQITAASRAYVPLQMGSKEIGVLGVSNERSQRAFGEHDKQVLRILADYAAIAIHNIRFLRHVEETKEQEKQRILDLFERYVAASVVKELLNQADKIALGGSDQVVSVLFADIRGFTHFSTQTKPEILVDVLNRHLTVGAEAILAEEGTLDKFMGDAVMAFFNAPLPQPDHALRAVRAAVGFHRAMAELHSTLPPSARLQFGIGICVGEAVVGNIGTPSLMNYTAIGETINIGQRLQAQARGGQTLICQRTFNIVREQIRARPLGTVQLRGLPARNAFELLGLQS